MTVGSASPPRLSRIGTSPPGPLRCGSTIWSAKPAATAASKALPPASSRRMPQADAIQWVEATAPNVPHSSGRAVKSLIGPTPRPDPSELFFDHRLEVLHHLGHRLLRRQVREGIGRRRRGGGDTEARDQGAALDQDQLLAGLQPAEDLGHAWRQVVEVDLFHGPGNLAPPRRA